MSDDETIKPLWEVPNGYGDSSDIEVWLKQALS
jgi:hypothetical protein